MQHCGSRIASKPSFRSPIRSRSRSAQLPSRWRHATDAHRLQAAKTAAEHDVQLSVAQFQEATCRRQMLLALAAAAITPQLGVGQARATALQDAARSVLRPDSDVDAAIVQLLDAKGTLLELKALAATAAGSEDRFRARRLLPGMAKRLRELGPTVPQLVALTTGGSKEQQLSLEYGGTGGDTSTGAVPIYIAIGDVITISGRTVRKEAQADPERAAAAIARIDDLLSSLPADMVQRAEKFRADRRAALFASATTSG